MLGEETMNRWGGNAKVLALKMGALALLAFAVYYAGLGFDAWSDFVNRDAFTITASGEGKVFVTPNIAMLSLTIRAQHTVLAEAQEAAATKGNGVTAFLKSRGVEEKDIKTTNYSVQPQYQYDNRPCVSGICPPQSPPRIVSYEIVNTLSVKVRDLESVGELLSGSIDAGANEVSGPVFEIDDPEAAKDEAKEMAVKQAEENARRIAEKLGLRLVRVVGYSESGGSEAPIMFSKMAEDSRGGVLALPPAPDVQVGQNEVRAFVTVTYRVR